MLVGVVVHDPVARVVHQDRPQVALRPVRDHNEAAAGGEIPRTSLSHTIPAGAPPPSLSGILKKARGRTTSAWSRQARPAQPSPMRREK